MIKIITIIIFLVVLTLLIGFSKSGISIQANSLHTTVSDNSIDVGAIPLKDFSFLSKDHNNEVEYIKNDIQKKVLYNQRKIFSIERSPSQKQIAFSFYPSGASSEDISIIIYDPYQDTRRKVYSSSFRSWDMRSELHWLDDEHIFFTRHCGTSCRGLTLINITSKEIKTAVLSYSSIPGEKLKTHFKDWFGHYFEFDGLVDEIYSEVKNNKSYLVFKLNDKAGKVLEEKRFLFTGDKTFQLIEQQTSLTGQATQTTSRWRLGKQ